MKLFRSAALPILPILAALLAACGALTPATPAAPTPAPTAVATPSPAPAAAPPDVLRWSIEGVSDLTTIDPARPGGLASVTVLGTVFNGLVRLDEQLEVQPDGASDWQVSDDGRVYTFTIREGLTFADGAPVTAADWVFSINRALAPETASYGAPTQLSHIAGAQDVIGGKAKAAAGVRALDARRLEITLDEPQAYFLAQLVYPYTFVVPRALVESGGDWAGRAYGTGPYRVESIRHGESIDLVANERYWRGRPGVPRLRFSFNADSEAAYRRYRAGELDIMGSWQSPVPAAAVAEAQALPDFQSAAILATRYIGFNNRRPPFDKVDLRRAFAQALDKRELVAGALHGNGIPADRILPTGLIGTQIAVQPLAYDPDAARQSLADAGFAGGAGLPELTISFAVEGDNGAVMQQVVEMWERALGVKVRLEPLALEEFSRRLDETYRAPESGLQMYYSVWGADYPDPHNFLSQQLETGTVNNNGHFSAPEFDQLVAEADQLGDRAQIERRLQLYAQAEQIAIDRVGWLPLFYPKFNILINPRVKGFVTTPNGLIARNWAEIRLAP